MSDLETVRLRFRRWRRDDLDTLARWNADERVMRYMGAPPLTREQSEAALGRYLAHWEEHGFGLWLAEDRESGAPVGRVGLAYHRAWPHDPEVGWTIDPAWWGRGLASEAGAACMRYGFEVLRAPRLVSITVEENLASRRVMEKLGFALLTKEPFPELDIELWIHARSSEPTALP